MAYVNVPRDLSKVRNKVVLNLTWRQIICFGLAAIIGFPFYFLTRGVIGNSAAMTGMILLMVPAFLFAMYEKDGLPLETLLKNRITVRYKRPAIRRYETGTSGFVSDKRLSGQSKTFTSYQERRKK